jgi:hypothetical protein
VPRKLDPAVPAPRKLDPAVPAPRKLDPTLPAAAVEPATGPRAARHNPSSALIGAAVAAVLAAGAAGAVAYVVASHHDHGNVGADGSSPRAQISTDNRARPGQSAGNAQVTSPGPRAVVDSYFAAINQRDWPRVWQLGGENANSSYRAMIDGYSETDHDVVRGIRVSGDHAVVRVRAYEANGEFQVYQMYFTIRNGVIVHATQQLLTTQPDGGAT